MAKEVNGSMKAYAMMKNFNPFHKHVSVDSYDNDSNNNIECISRAPFHVKHAHLCRKCANTEIQNTCI